MQEVYGFHYYGFIYNKEMEIDKDKIDLELSQIEAMINKAKLEWDRYFGGGSKTPPWQLQKEIENKLKIYSQNPSKLSYAQNFRLNSILGKFNSLKEKNEKLMRMKDEGYMAEKKISLVPSTSTSAATEKEEKVPESVRKGEDEGYKKLFDDYIQARKKCGEPTDKIKYEIFRETIEKQKKQISEKVKSKEIEFYITIEDGKAKLKARPKK